MVCNYILTECMQSIWYGKIQLTRTEQKMFISTDVAIENAVCVQCFVHYVIQLLACCHLSLSLPFMSFPWFEYLEIFHIVLSRFNYVKAIKMIILGQLNGICGMMITGNAFNVANSSWMVWGQHWNGSTVLITSVESKEILISERCCAPYKQHYPRIKEWAHMFVCLKCHVFGVWPKPISPNKHFKLHLNGTSNCVYNALKLSTTNDLPWVEHEQDISTSANQLNQISTLFSIKCVFSGSFVLFHLPI